MDGLEREKEGNRHNPTNIWIPHSQQKELSSLRQRLKDRNAPNQPISQTYGAARRQKAKSLSLPPFRSPSSCFHLSIFPSSNHFQLPRSLSSRKWSGVQAFASLRLTRNPEVDCEECGSAQGSPQPCCPPGAGPSLGSLRPRRTRHKLKTRNSSLPAGWQASKYPKHQNETVLELGILDKVPLPLVPVTPVFHPLRRMPRVGRAATRRQICLLCRF